MKRLGLVIDQERCIGCEACTVACKMENGSPLIRVETLGGGQKDTPAGRYPALKMEFLPRLCMHCESPQCLQVCGNDALRKRDDGVIILDKEKCDGCQACVTVCPYEAISCNPRTGLVEKCNLCAHRIDSGLEPFCVTCCEGQAMYFGDLNDPSSEVAQLISRRHAFTLMPEAGAGPAVYYCPPRERRAL